MTLLSAIEGVNKICLLQEFLIMLHVKRKSAVLLILSAAFAAAFMILMVGTAIS